MSASKATIIEIGQGAYIDLYPIATRNIGALEGDGPRLANTDGGSIVESCLNVNRGAAGNAA